MAEDTFPRKILMTGDAMGGVWTYALDLARQLGKSGVHVVLATMGAFPTPNQREETGAIPNLELVESNYRLEWMQDPWEDVARAGDWLMEMEDRVRPDIIHLNGYAHATLPWRAPKVVVGHSCVLSWWRAVKGEGASAIWREYRQRVSAGLQAAQVVIAPSAAMLRALEDNYGSLAAGKVVPNGRAPALFPPAAKEPLVFSAGRLWDEGKNIAGLDQIAPRLPWPVYVAGEREHPNGRGAAPANVQLLGRLSTGDLASWLGRASIYCMPSRYEPFGLSALEAALAGCALVLGDIASLHEVWESAAMFVSPDEPHALEAAIGKLIRDPSCRADFAARARRRALEFTPERMAQGYLAAYLQSHRSGDRG